MTGDTMNDGYDERRDDPNEVFAATIEGAQDALEAIGWEAVIVCADGEEPFASLDLGDGYWLDAHATVRKVES